MPFFQLSLKLLKACGIYLIQKSPGGRKVIAVLSGEQERYILVPFPKVCNVSQGLVCGFVGFFPKLKVRTFVVCLLLELLMLQSRPSVQKQLSMRSGKGQEDSMCNMLAFLQSSVEKNIYFKKR